MARNDSNPGARGRGRPKGSLNKSTLAVKEALIKAFDGIGGLAAFIEWGKANQGEFYKLWSKMLPTEIKTSDGMPLVVKIIDLSGEDGDSSTGEN